MSEFVLRKFEALVNRVIRNDPVTIDRLAEISGKILSLEFINTRTAIYIFPQSSGIRLESGHSGEVDVCIRGTPVNMLAYLMSAAGNGNITGKMEISGDVGLAQYFQSIVKDIDLDWEEQLSRWTGDTLARKMGNIARNSSELAKNAGHTLALDISEYLRYEKEVLPDRYEVDEYISAIDKLRDDTERLKIRIDRLSGASLEQG